MKRRDSRFLAKDNTVLQLIHDRCTSAICKQTLLFHRFKLTGFPVKRVSNLAQLVAAVDSGLLPHSQIDIITVVFHHLGGLSLHSQFAAHAPDTCSRA